VTTQGWAWLNWGSLVPVLITGAGLLWLKKRIDKQLVLG
jgi:hypothetical protein